MKLKVGADFMRIKLILVTNESNLSITDTKPLRILL